MLELFKRFAGAYRRAFIIGPACKLAEVVFDILTPLVIAAMIDDAVTARSVDGVLRYGAVLFVFALVGIAFALVCQKMAALTSQGMGTDIRRELFRHINRLSAAEVDRFGTPSLITRLTGDVNQVQLAVALAIRQLIRWPFLALGSMIAALAIDWQLGLIFLVCTPVIGGIFWLVMARCVPYFKTVQAKLDRIGLITREGLSGVRVIRAFVREDHERERFRVAAREQAETAIAVGRLSSVLNPVTFLVMNLGVCAILWTGGVRVDAGGLTQGEVVAFVNYMTQTLTSVVYVANLVVVFTKASASAGRIDEVLACAPSVTDEGAAPVDLVALAEGLGASAGRDEEVAGSAEGAAADAARRAVEVEPMIPPAGTGADGSATDAGAAAQVAASVPAIRLAHASFAYRGAAANAVDDISFALMPGQTLGVIGGTGSGKSTLVSLLPRLYDVSTGSVELFGRDVRRWPIDQLRHVVGFVPQRASLVSGTIRSNLSWRDAAATDEELWRALEVAQAASFVRALPEGLDAPVEAGGKNFSGGQRQRLTIARALVGEPDVLVLDDAASALDFKTDAALRHAIAARAAAGTRRSGTMPLTTVIVSQRVSSVRDADLICVMRRGRAVGLGTHEELRQTCSVYREICASQGSNNESAGPACDGSRAEGGEA